MRITFTRNFGQGIYCGISRIFENLFRDILRTLDAVKSENLLYMNMAKVIFDSTFIDSVALTFNIQIKDRPSQLKRI